MSRIMGATKSLKSPVAHVRRAEDVPFAIRERQNISRLIRRTRLANFIGTMMLLALIACACFAMSSLRLSSDPDYIKPW
jgi:hypothetical protein